MLGFDFTIIYQLISMQTFFIKNFCFIAKFYFYENLLFYFIRFKKVYKVVESVARKKKMFNIYKKNRREYSI